MGLRSAPSPRSFCPQSQPIHGNRVGFFEFTTWFDLKADSRLFVGPEQIYEDGGEDV
jgi:hypothetical protein